MKKRLSLILLFLTIIFVNDIFSQDTNTSIGGIYLNKSYNNAEIMRILGIDALYYQSEGENGIYDIYKSHNSSFEFFEGILEYADIYSPKFKINGLVGVGDNISKLKQLPKELLNCYPSEKRCSYDTELNDAYAIQIYYNNKGIINRIDMYINL